MRADAKDMVVSLLIAGLLAVTSFLYFQFIQPYALFFKEQIRLFLYTSEYFLSYLNKPGTLSCFLGDFLTQFLYLRGGGALVVSLLFLLEWLVVYCVLKRFGGGTLTPLWALLPVLADWFFLGQIYYTLAIPVSLILVLVFFLMYSVIRKRAVALVTGLFFVPLLYSLVGAGMCLFPLLLLFYESDKKRGMLWAALLILLIAAVYPSFIRHSYLLTVEQAYLYPLAGWRYVLSGVIVLGLVVALLFFRKQNNRVTARVFVAHVLTVFILWIVCLVFATDRDREPVLALASESYFGHWDRVYDLAEKKKLSNGMATYYANMALAGRGELGDRLMEYDQPGSSGLFLPVNPGASWFTIFFSSDVYYFLGDMTMAQHSAMLGMIFSPRHRSSRMVKRLAELNLILGDSTATEKYLRMLDATRYHKKWAARMREVLSSDQTEDYPWLTEKRAQLATQDRLRWATDNETALKVLVKSNPDNRVALDYLLSYYLLNKDISSFRATFDTYCKGKVTYTPRAYSEALLISLAATKATEKEFQSYQLDDRIVKAFGEYTTLYEESEGAPDPIRERFAGSYWMYYHFAQAE